VADPTTDDATADLVPEELPRPGRFGPWGGRYVPEALIPALEQLDEARQKAAVDPEFIDELARLHRTYTGRPSIITEVPRFAAHAGNARIILKREDLNHTGSHKINNVLAQALLTKRMGKTRVIAETGAGQHGVATATAAALMGLECVIYMGKVDTERQALNVARMRMLGAEVVAVPTIRLYLKREDLAHTGAHKINNALGQAMLTRRLGKSRVIAETGAGQHGVATATACALLDLPCVVYMGAEDIERQGPNVLRMRALGAEVRPVTSGTATLKDAVNEAMRDWVTNVATTHYVLGSAMGPHPYPTIVRDLQRRIGDEAAAQMVATEGRLPDLALACVGGGSNAIGLLARFIGEPSVRLAVAEAAGDGIETGRHAAAILGGTPGILHGSRSLMLQDRDGQVVEAHSASAGLDYPGIGPQLAALAEAGRIEVAAATDREAVAAMKATTRTEGILPALETAHAIAALPKILAGVEGLAGGFAPDRELLVLLGFSGRGDKDLAALTRFDDVQPWASVR